LIGSTLPGLPATVMFLISMSLAAAWPLISRFHAALVSRMTRRAYSYRSAPLISSEDVGH